MRRTYSRTMRHGLRRVLAVSAALVALPVAAVAAATAPTLAAAVIIGAVVGVAATRLNAGRVLSTLRAPERGDRTREEGCPNGARC